jgi:hypothetical protein
MKPPMFFLKKKQASPKLSRTERHRESAQFEQIIAELQGLRLRIEGGEGRGVYVKVGRLARIFAERAGISDARDMNEAEFKKALDSSEFSAQQAQSLIRIVERCEHAAREDTVKLDFDPLDMVREFREVIDEFEGRDSG